MEIKKDPTWDPASTPTFWVNHASRLLMRHFERRLRPLDFGMASLPVVLALQEHGPLQQKDLAERAHVEQPSMATLLSRMERDGVISRSPHPTDKRASRVSLTAKAKARLPAAKELMRDVAEQALSGLTESERATLLRLMQRVVKNLHEP